MKEQREMIRLALVQRAKEARKKAYCPYSGFAVGAALLCADGSVYDGCNIENAGFTATCCAERTAFFRAVNDGKRDFKAIAIAGGRAGEEPTGICAPCGVCRQVMAEFCGPGDDPNRQRQSEYLVRTVFNGNWLPGASPETVAEAQRIIGEVINKLRVWVRGYLTLMVVDATVYTTAFFFLGVPYFALLGPLAGCGILLPYIGPILSALVTILVTLAVGGSSVSGLQLAGIIATYLIYNGVIEQFILYPAVIGESLGLTTLETIIVVLLGAIFAGIPGMILALPAASVIKYLVPQFYRTVRR